MRHRKRGRRLGRSASHRKAMMRNLASSLFLTERDAEYDDNPPRVNGRVVTTLHKAKEVRPLVERCITIARRSLPHSEAAREYESDAQRGSEQWKVWRNSDQWQKWNAAIAPAVAARRRAIQLLGDKQAVSILFDTIAPRFADRDGGYTRILKLATPRLGDAGARAILELVGVRDRVSQKSERPAFDDEGDAPESDSQQDVRDEVATEEEESAAESDDAEAKAEDEGAAEGDDQEKAKSD